jgi:hypothetical protein
MAPHAPRPLHAPHTPRPLHAPHTPRPLHAPRTPNTPHTPRPLHAPNTPHTPRIPDYTLSNGHSVKNLATKFALQGAQTNSGLTKKQTPTNSISISKLTPEQSAIVNHIQKKKGQPIVSDQFNTLFGRNILPRLIGSINTHIKPVVGRFLGGIVSTATPPTEVPTRKPNDIAITNTPHPVRVSPNIGTVLQTVRKTHELAAAAATTQQEPPPKPAVATTQRLVAAAAAATTQPEPPPKPAVATTQRLVAAAAAVATLPRPAAATVATQPDVLPRPAVESPKQNAGPPKNTAPKNLSTRAERRAAKRKEAREKKQTQQQESTTTPEKSQTLPQPNASMPSLGVRELARLFEQTGTVPSVVSPKPKGFIIAGKKKTRVGKKTFKKLKQQYEQQAKLDYQIKKARDALESGKGDGFLRTFFGFPGSQEDYQRVLNGLERKKAGLEKSIANTTEKLITKRAKASEKNAANTQIMIRNAKERAVQYAKVLDNTEHVDVSKLASLFGDQMGLNKESTKGTKKKDKGFNNLSTIRNKVRNRTARKGTQKNLFNQNNKLKEGEMSTNAFMRSMFNEPATKVVKSTSNTASSTVAPIASPKSTETSNTPGTLFNPKKSNRRLPSSMNSQSTAANAASAGLFG